MLLFVVVVHTGYEKVVCDVSWWNMCAWWFVSVRGRDQTSVVLSSLSDRSWFFWLNFSFFECGSSPISSGVNEESLSLLVLMLGSTPCCCGTCVVWRFCVVEGGFVGAWLMGGRIGVTLWGTI